MDLNEVKTEILNRLEHKKCFKEIPEYFEALETAVKCIEAQELLLEVLEGIGKLKTSDRLSARLCYDLLDQIRWDFEPTDVMDELEEKYDLH